MEAFTATTKNMSHTRSISLPTRPHPSVADVEEHLCRIRSSDATSTSSLCNKLTGLNDLYECLDDLIQSPMMPSCDSEDVLGASDKKSNEGSVIVNLLKEVEQVSLTVVESLFSSVFPAKETSKQNRWSMVFKPIRVHGASENSFNEAQKMQIDLEALYKQKINFQTDFTRIQQTQKSLIALDMNMQQCEQDLECLFRSLIKSRVSILNVLN
ncbi:hypothetical protein POM88_053998 [Heracleum sosnowskyi]|uniref:Uncharacterized protein n=1 Tax=Heracleum sosnowskyi TaxID=360622 RepID=A0AAD8GP95_9APIA|nr:hypothetical protein POM88_053998 [Heracleum sosnowskyi]